MTGYRYLVIGVLAIAIVAIVAVALAIQRLGWAYAAHRLRWRSRTGFRGKTLWDWLQLLVIPLALAAIALSFNFLQSAREQAHEDARKDRELDIADGQRRLDARLAVEARRDDALSAYLEQMRDLALRHKFTSHPTLDVRVLARTLTRTVLRRLDGRRKRRVIQFLGDAHLRLRLGPADLRDLDVRDVDLSGMDLSGTDLRGADFRGASLRNVDFTQADLRGPNSGKQSWAGRRSRSRA